MSDQNIAAIGRRLAVAASRQAYERSTDTAKDFRDALTELCAAVRAEQSEQSNDNPVGSV